MPIGGDLARTEVVQKSHSREYIGQFLGNFASSGVLEKFQPDPLLGNLQEGEGARKSWGFYQLASLEAGLLQLAKGCSVNCLKLQCKLISAPGRACACVHHTLGSFS